jgi:hypothetical protein
MLAAFRNVSSHTELQLAGYRDRVRLHARAGAISRVDNAALENVRRVAGPVLERVASGEAPSPALRMGAVLADATLRDDLLAPGFLTPVLAERVRAARIAGAHVTVDVARLGDAVLTETARRLLAAALAGLAAGDGVTLKIYPPAGESPALLILRVRGQPGTAALRRRADELGALVSDLGDDELLIRTSPASRSAGELAGPWIVPHDERPADPAGRSLRATSCQAQERDLPHGCGGRASIWLSRLARWTSISASR